MEFALSNQVEWLPNSGWDSRIHIASNPDLVNVFVVVSQRYVILVDTLLNPTTGEALVEDAQPYLSDRQLLVINSHADWDHAWGNQLFAGPSARYPAPIIAHANATAIYERPDTHDYLRQAQSERPDIFGAVILTKPTVTFRDELWIDGGDLTLHLFPAPGHTPDHIAIFIPEISTLLAGDAAEIPFPFLNNAADLPALRASLRAMADLQPRHALYCHAPPEVGPQLLHDNLAYYDALEAACRAALAQGMELSAIANADLPATLKCHYADVVPTTGAWTDVSPDARSERHGEQLRFMLEWLQEQAGYSG